tara:strand:- start:4507 stop:4875 length:369 start_codon:yes stop_codon:yes gene_type:complete
LTSGSVYATLVIETESLERVHTMSFAPENVGFTYGDSSIQGSFLLKENDNFFEFSTNNETGFGEEYPHKVWVTTPWNMDQGFRFAIVKKTVAYILTTDANGDDVVEKWNIKQHRKYTKLFDK